MKAQYLRGVAPSVTISGQNDRLVMGRLVQSRQVEGTNVYRADDVIATSGNIQFVPFAPSTPPIFAKPKLVLDDGTVTVDLPDKIIRRAGRAARFLLEHRRIRDLRQLDDFLGDAQRVRRSAEVGTVIGRPYLPYQ